MSLFESFVFRDKCTYVYIIIDDKQGLLDDILNKEVLLVNGFIRTCVGNEHLQSMITMVVTHYYFYSIKSIYNALNEILNYDDDNLSD